MSLPHGRHIRVSARYPEAAGRCDRTGFLFNRRDLQWQYQWAGQSLVNLQFLVGPQYLDEPQEQLRSIIIPSDPVPVWQPRPEHFSVEEA